MERKKNSQKPERINQSIIGNTWIGGDVKTGDIIQNNQTTITNNYSTENTLRTKPFQAQSIPEYYVERPEVTEDLKKRLLADGGT
mgnify:CR=1 FL=1